MPRRDGNRSGVRRRSGRNHAPMNSGRKGRQHSPKYIRRKRAEDERNANIKASKRMERATRQREAANSTLTGRALAPDVPPGRRIYLQL